MKKHPTLNDIITLQKEGKHVEAKQLFAEYYERVKKEPNRIRLNKDGTSTFYQGNRRIEQDADGEWKPVKK
ncbi:MAG: hypothetical protein ACRECY_16990 [Phyllobacterium sp.]